MKRKNSEYVIFDDYDDEDGIWDEDELDSPQSKRQRRPSPLSSIKSSAENSQKPKSTEKEIILNRYRSMPILDTAGTSFKLKKKVR